jgi:hypothetical protein
VNVWLGLIGIVCDVWLGLIGIVCECMPWINQNSK